MIELIFDAPDEEVKPCRCGSMPNKETQGFMMGKIEDGGYSVTIGRFHCPVCDDGPSWGQSYSIYRGWNKNIMVWNRWIEKGGADHAMP